jgi:hypothetical protein
MRQMRTLALRDQCVNIRSMGRSSVGRNRGCQAANYAKPGLITARRPAVLRADPDSWLAVDAAPERDDLRAATCMTDAGLYR